MYFAILNMIRCMQSSTSKIYLYFRLVLNRIWEKIIRDFAEFLKTTVISS